MLDLDRGADGAFKVTAGTGIFAARAGGFKRHAADYGTPEGRRFTPVDSEGFAFGSTADGRREAAGAKKKRPITRRIAGFLRRTTLTPSDPDGIGATPGLFSPGNSPMVPLYELGWGPPFG